MTTLYDTVLLTAQRLAEGRCMAEMARAINRSPQWMTKYVRGEHGRSGMTLGTVELLARAFDTEPITLLLPTLSDTGEKRLIMVCYLLARWIRDTSVRILTLARARDSRVMVLSAIRTYGHAWELGAVLGAMTEPPQEALLAPIEAASGRVMRDRGIDICPASGAACPYYEQRPVISDVSDNSEGCHS